MRLAWFLIATLAAVVPHGSSALSPLAPSADYSAVLLAAIADWNANLASGTEVQERIALRFEDIASEYPAGWEAPFWASHARTQLQADDIPGALANMDLAQELLDLAGSRLATPSDDERAEFHMMQALIHSNRAYVQQDATERTRLLALAGPDRLAAEQLNPDNPRVWMQRGFDLIRARRMDEGRIMLTQALGKFDAYPSDNPLWPDWGRPWIGFWLGGIEKRERQELPERAPGRDS